MRVAWLLGLVAWACLCAFLAAVTADAFVEAGRAMLWPRSEPPLNTVWGGAAAMMLWIVYRVGAPVFMPKRSA